MQCFDTKPKSALCFQDILGRTKLIGTGKVHAFIELHIEQAPDLENKVRLSFEHSSPCHRNNYTAFETQLVPLVASNTSIHNLFEHCMH
jgi:hypothetical protein